MDITVKLSKTDQRLSLNLCEGIIYNIDSVIIETRYGSYAIGVDPDEFYVRVTQLTTDNKCNKGNITIIPIHTHSVLIQ